MLVAAFVTDAFVFVVFPDSAHELDGLFDAFFGGGVFGVILVGEALSYSELVSGRRRKRSGCKDKLERCGKKTVKSINQYHE